MSKVKLAIIGCGKVSHMHLGGLRELPEQFELVAVCDASAEALANYLPGHDLKRVQSIEVIADDESIDATIVILPHDAHHAAVKTLLEADKHVLVEKPFAFNAQQAVELVRLAKQRDRTLVVGHTQRHSPVGKTMKSILDRGDLGDVFGVNAKVLQYLPHYMAPQSGHWLYSAEKAGGGIVISVCVHKLDLFRFLFGEVQTVSAQFEIDKQRSSADRPYEWTAAINLKFRSGAIGNLFTCYKAYSDIWEPETLLVLGENGTARASGWEEFEVISRSVPERARRFNTYRPQAENEWTAQLRAYHATITRGEPNPADGADAVHTMALIDAIYKSGTTGGAAVSPKTPDI
jgi:predicted dehydrogenase